MNQKKQGGISLLHTAAERGTYLIVILIKLVIYFS